MLCSKLFAYWGTFKSKTLQDRTAFNQLNKKEFYSLNTARNAFVSQLLLPLPNWTVHMMLDNYAWEVLVGSLKHHYRGSCRKLSLGVLQQQPDEITEPIGYRSRWKESGSLGCRYHGIRKLGGSSVDEGYPPSVQCLATGGGYFTKVSRMNSTCTPGDKAVPSTWYNVG